MSNWVVVPALLEGRDQMDERFPNRDHGAEGTIGDQSHQSSSSSHNPDETGKPEYSDHDGINEVRAIDWDKDLNDAGGVTMEQVVQLWLTLLRSGQMWWVRYLIYKGRIWHRRDNFVTREYNGGDKHESHVHATNDFTQAADTVRNTNWHLSELNGPGEVPVSDSHLSVDGKLGPKTIAKWQRVMGTPVDGKISSPSDLVKAVQTKLKSTVDASLKVDGYGIVQGGKRSKTIGALQRYLKSPVDEYISSPVSEVVKALQRRLNEDRF
jgi:hypothetical protein